MISDSKIRLVFSIILISLGVIILILTPFLSKFYLIEFQKLEILKISLPSGWAICGLGFCIMLIDRMPQIIDAIKKIRK